MFFCQNNIQSFAQKKTTIQSISLISRNIFTFPSVSSTDMYNIIFQFFQELNFALINLFIGWVKMNNIFNREIDPIPQ